MPPPETGGIARRGPTPPRTSKFIATPFVAHRRPAVVPWGSLAPRDRSHRRPSRPSEPGPQGTPGRMTGRGNLPHPPVRASSVNGPGSPADDAGLLPGDELVAVGGRPLRDVIEYRLLSDDAEVDLELRRGDLDFGVEIVKAAGVPLGIEVDSPVFDEIRTCDNHCEFCFTLTSCPRACVGACT